MRILSVPLIALCMFACTPAAEKAPARVTKSTPLYAGEWWQGQDSIEQYGFVSGAGDCYFGDFGGGDSTARGPVGASIGRISAYYRTGGNTLAAPVLRVLYPTEFDSGKSRAAPQLHSGVHETYDALYWNHMYSNPNEQRGFMEGYLACVQEFLPADASHLQLGPQQYVTLLNDWYDGESHQEMTIATSLRRMGKVSDESAR